MRGTMLLLALGIASGPAAAPAATVTGTVSYRERIALPPDAALEVTLEDVSRADAPSGVLGRALVEPAGQVPIRFAIAYDGTRVDPGHRYGVRARITSQGRPLFVSTRSVPVLTHGAGGEVEVVVRPVGPPSRTQGRAIEGGRWKLKRLPSSSEEPSSDARRPSLELDPSARRAAGLAGCNRFACSYALDGASLTFGKDMAATQMMCNEGMELERAFLAALGEVRSWRTRGAELELLDARGEVVASFAPSEPP